MMNTLDPLEMLLDAARYVEDSKPQWAKSARAAVVRARSQPGTLARGECAAVARDFHKTITDSEMLAANVKAIGANIADAILALSPTRSLK
jgi:hypothetical protein